MIAIGTKTNSKLIQATGTILVNKSVEIVFNFFTNPGNDSFWRTEINQSTLDGPIQQGVTVSEYSNLSKKVPNNLLELKCVRLEKNKVAIFETTEDSKFYLKNQREVKAVSGNSTEVIYTLDFDVDIVKFALGFGLPKFIVSIKANSDMKKYLRQLKNHLENRP